MSRYDQPACDVRDSQGQRCVLAVGHLGDCIAPHGSFRPKPVRPPRGPKCRDFGAGRCSLDFGHSGGHVDFDGEPFGFWARVGALFGTGHWR